MKKYTLLFLLSVFATYGSKAQTIEDAFRISQQDIEGTARYTSMGGAFGALGGDFTTLSINPAGIGVYRVSEFSLTPSINYNTVNSEYLGLKTDDNRLRFGFSNIGYVGTYKTHMEDEKGLVTFNLGIGYNKVMNYHRNTAMRGNNAKKSITNHFANKVNGDLDYYREGFKINDIYSAFAVNEWDAVLGYETYAIDYKEDKKLFENYLDEGESVTPRRYASESGSTGEYVFSIGGNISNKFYFGATLGVQDVGYTRTVSYMESSNQSITKFKGLTYREYFETSGTGYNGKFGIIYRPVNQLRLGAAIHTPTFYYLTDYYFARMNYGDSNDQTPQTNYDYRMQSPFRSIFSAAYTFGKYGLLSVDYEYANYKGTRMRDVDDHGVFDESNRWVRSYFKNTSTVRVGGELRATDQISVRAGFAYAQNPIDKDAYTQSSIANTGEISYFPEDKFTYSAGFGYRMDWFFADFAYSLQTTKGTYKPHLAASTEVKEDMKRGLFMLTMGFRF